MGPVIIVWNKKKAKQPLETESKFKELVLQTLAGNGSLSEEELFEILQKPASAPHLNCLRQLVEEGKVKNIEGGKYKLNLNA